MSIKNWEHFFKPEIRNSGQRYFTAGNVSVSQPSDTEIVSYIRGSSSYKVSLKSPSMASNLIQVDCNCPAAKKGQMCKHIWATLLVVDDKRSDFFDGKTEIQKTEPTATQDQSRKFTKSSFRSQPKPLTESQIESQNAFKEKQANYKKQQYQKQKQKLKERKQAKKRSSASASDLPKSVEVAFAYFSENGFPMDNPPKSESIQLAKKKLSRVFHPDIGGTHDEIVELNNHSEVLLAFIAVKKKPKLVP